MNSAEAIDEKSEVSFFEISLFLFFSLFATEKKTLVHICLFSFIALCPFQDFILQGTSLRSLGMSPAIFPLGMLAFIHAAEWLYSTKWDIASNIMICGLYILTTAVYGLILFGMSSHGENLIWKGTTSLISLLALVFASNLNYGSPIVRTAVYVAFVLLLLGFLFGNSNPLGLPALAENGVLHYTPLPDERPRGLASEPSQLSTTAIIIGLLAVHMTESRRWKTILLVVTLGLLLASGSKGGILTLFICVVVLSVMKWHKTWYQIAASLFLLFPLGLILIWLIPNLFPEESFALSGTIPTRFSMIICALMTVIHQPFGVGVTGFLPAVAKYLPDAMASVQSFSPFPLYFGEVSAYLTSADMVSTKTFFFDQLMRFGIPFALFFFMFIAGLLKHLAAHKQWIMLAAIIASTIAITTYAPGTGNFAVAIVFGVALHEVKNAPNPRRCE